MEWDKLEARPVENILTWAEQTERLDHVLDLPNATGELLAADEQDDDCALGLCVNFLFTESVLDTFAFMHMNRTYTEVKICAEKDFCKKRVYLIKRTTYLISMKVHGFCLESWKTF